MVDCDWDERTREETMKRRGKRGRRRRRRSMPPSSVEKAAFGLAGLTHSRRYITTATNDDVSTVT